METKGVVSQVDQYHLTAIRKNIQQFLSEAGLNWGNNRGLLLDIAPQAHEGARPFFSDKMEIETLDIDPCAGTTYCADLCITNDKFPPTDLM